MDFNIGDVLSYGWPGAIWRVEENDINRIIWVSEDIPRPSNDEIIEMAEKYAIERKKTAYIDRRAVAYPSIQEQLDMLYWDKINGTDRWMDSITNIKAAYAKGE